MTPIGDDTGPYVKRTVQAIASVHQLDWRSRLHDWELPRTMAGELDLWERLLNRAAEDQWQSDGRRLVEALRASDPGNHQIGLFHGDFQTNTILFSADDGHIAAIVDWEIAGIGPVDVDAAWLSMMTDVEAWDEARAATLQVRIDPFDIRSWYENGRAARWSTSTGTAPTHASATARLPGSTFACTAQVTA